MKTLIALMLFSNVALAQGASFLALCNTTWDCRKTLQTFSNSKVIVTGWLERSFGTSCPCADKILAAKKPKVVRIHLANGPCLRNRRCGPQEVFFGRSLAQTKRLLDSRPEAVLSRFRRVIPLTQKRLAKASNTSCFISPVLESDFTARHRLLFLNIAKESFPGCSIVDNPLHYPCIKGFTCEKHGDNVRLKAPCIVDMDGVDGSKVDLKRFRKVSRACLRLYWEPWMNCLRDGKFVDPFKRNCKFKKERFTTAKEKLWRLL